MLDSARFLVTKEIAIRSGSIDSRYRIADGRFVLDNKDLSHVRFTTDEYINGLKGIEKVGDEEARSLIAQNGFKMGVGDEEENVFNERTQENEPQESGAVNEQEELPNEETETDEIAQSDNVEENETEENNKTTEE